MKTPPDYSPAFYRHHARRYAEVSHGFIQSVYTQASHPGLKDDLSLIKRLQELAPPGSRGLDAGCGAGARDVFFYWRDGYDMYGVDAVEENIRVAQELHPEIANRVSVADLTQPLHYPAAFFDFVLCNAVIQHIAPELVMKVTIPELARVLKVGGVLQLMFKTGWGIVTVYDKDYASPRTFHLYEADEILTLVKGLGMEVVPAEADKLGGVMFFTDPKAMEHCAFYACKTR